MKVITTKLLVNQWRSLLYDVTSARSDFHLSGWVRPFCVSWSMTSGGLFIMGLFISALLLPVKKGQLMYVHLMQCHNNSLTSATWIQNICYTKHVGQHKKLKRNKVDSDPVPLPFGDHDSELFTLDRTQNTLGWSKLRMHMYRLGGQGFHDTHTHHTHRHTHHAGTHAHNKHTHTRTHHPHGHTHRHTPHRHTHFTSLAHAQRKA